MKFAPKQGKVDENIVCANTILAEYFKVNGEGTIALLVLPALAFAGK